MNHTKEEQFKVLEDRIRMLQDQINRLRRGEGFSLGGDELQIASWQREIRKAEKQQAKIFMEGISYVG